MGGEPVLRRCGSQRRERLSYGGPYGEHDTQVAGRVASWIAPQKNNSAAFYVTRLTNKARAWHGVIYVLYGPRYGTARGTPQRGAWALAHASTTIYQSNVLQEKPGLPFADELSNVYAAHIP